MDEFNHQIFEMVSSSDVNEKKGGILAIGKERRIDQATYENSMFILFLAVRKNAAYTGVWHVKD